MTFGLRIAPLAQRNIDEFAAYLRAYSEDFAIEQIDRLERTLSANIAESPFTWSYFPFTGAPFRAYLFRVGRRTQYWIIYTVDEATRMVNILHFWNARRDPETLDLPPP
jgi:plasmid stabilization system protein ParE